jgi:hypothetical protein
MATTNGIAGKRKDWDIYNHASWIFTFRLFGLDGQPVDGSAAVFSGSIRKDQDQASQQYVNFDADSFSLSGDNSYVTLTKLVSIPQAVQQAFYDIKAVLPGGEVIVFPVYGFVNVNNQRP